MRPWLLSKCSSTEARPTGLRAPAPLKMTSCIDSPRSADAFDSPSTQRTASMTLDLPQPLGPTMPTSWPGVAIVVGSTNDLNPESLICVRRKGDFDQCVQALNNAYRPARASLAARFRKAWQPCRTAAAELTRTAREREAWNYNGNASSAVGPGVRRATAA